MTFGTILREARERKGYDLATAARRLRIRPDILRAIEEDDFSRMPPRGYARNMVNAYARLVGLNPTEMTRMYLDEAYAYQVGRARNGAQPGGGSGSSRPSRSATRQHASAQVDERPPRQNAFGRTMYDDRRDYGRDYGTRGGAGAGGRLYSEDRTHPSRHAALPNSEYTNFYAGPKASSVGQSKLPFIIAGVAVLALLIVVLVLVFGGKGGNANEDLTKMPVTGLADTTQGEDAGSEGSDGAEGAADTKPKAAETAPTSAKVVYKVAKGQEIYASIATDGNAVDQMLTGPVEETVEVTGTWSIATWVTDAVTVTLDGEELEPSGTDASGMPMWEVDFDAYLEKWYEDHPDAKKPAGSASGTSDADATGSGGTDANAGGAGTGTGDGSANSGSAA